MKIKNKSNRKRNRIIVGLCLIVFMLSVSSLFASNYNNFDNNTNLSIASDNYLFNGKEYQFDLDDVYDDENYTKIYTGANFQTVFLENESAILNETVSPVNNTCYKSPSLGDYPATYTFDDQPVGTTDTDIYLVNSLGVGYSAEIVEEHGGHKKVMKVDTTYSISNQKIELNRTYFGSTTSDVGTVEFWFELTSGSDLYFRLKHSPRIVQIRMLSTHAIILTGDGETTYYYTTSGLKHYKIEYDCPNNLTSVWIEGNLVIDNEPTINDVSATYLERWYFEHTESTTFYMDAVGSSLYPEYTPSEHHAGTYSFTNDAIGSNPDDWICTETGGAIDVIEEKDDHKKVLELYDDDPVNSVYATNNFPTIQIDGTVEFWWAYNATETLHHYLFIGFKEGASERVTLCLNYYWAQLGGIQVFYGSAYHQVVGAYPVNTSRHIKLIFDDTNNEVEIVVNDVSYGEFQYRSNSVEGIDNLIIRTRTANAGGVYTHWIDALGLSGDPYYTIGDNLNPSLGNTMPVGLEMLNGTFDNTDNMKSNDDSNSEFTSTEGVFTPDGEFIDSITYEYGSAGAGNLGNTQTDDSNYQQIEDGNRGGFRVIWIIFNINPVYAGRDFYFSFHSWTDAQYDAKLYVNGGQYLGDLETHDFDDVLFNDVTSIKYRTNGLYTDHIARIYYFKLVENIEPISAVLNFTIDLNFNEVDTSKLLALDVSSHHYTNVSTTIVGNIYDYDSSSYTQMFSSSNTAETENYFVDNSSVGNYLNSSGNLRLQFRGTNSNSDFKQIIDYIKVRFYYKMDLTHSIKFTTNGLWKYRWELFGSIQYTSWTYFEVIDPNPNFYAISESDLTTRWILQNASLTAVEDFHDDINTDYWDLVDVSENSFYTSPSNSYLFDNTTGIRLTYTGTNFNLHDTSVSGIVWDGSFFYVIGVVNKRAFKYTSTGSYVSESALYSTNWHPRGVCWDGTYFYVPDYDDDVVYKYSATWVYQTSYGLNVGNTYASGIVWDGSFFYVTDPTSDMVYKYNSAWVFQASFALHANNGGAFGICWDGTYFYVADSTDSKVHKYDTAWVFQGATDIMTNPRGIDYDGTNFWVVKDIATFDKVYEYEYSLNVSKNYFGGGYTYMQTNTTELISLKSIDYGTHKTLSSGDYFEVDFQTSSDSKINLILLKNGEINKTLTLSQSGNTNFNRHTAKISVAESLEFDQLKISSTFEDEDYVKVYDIKTYKYTITGDTADFYVGSKRDYEVYLTPDTYNLRITEEEDEKVNTNITIPATGVLQYVYTPIERLECRLTLFNTEGSHLDFMDYHIKINRSLNDIYNEFWLLDSIFSADKDTYAYISIYDRFDTLIDTFERLTSEYIDLEIEVYSLQIKNLMTQKTTLDINASYTYPLLSGDSIYFMLSKEYYKIGYYDTNDVYKQFTIYLNSNQAYELNRSKICFLSYADQQGNHLFFENYKTYLNGSLLYENVFYREIGDNVGIEIKDRYGISIKNETYTVVSGDNYIPITLIMYSLKIMNQQEIFNWINITRDPNYYESSMYWSEWIAPSEIIEFKLFSGYYKINLTDNENSGSSYYSYTLNGDDILLISSGNTISNLIINIANVNSTIGNQITNVQIDLTNQNSNINNTIINIDINLSNVNSTLGNLLTNINLDIININNNISNLYTFTENNFLNLGNNINNSFISIENNIIAINQTISTLVIGLDGKITIVNATINTMFTEMNSQFIVTQSTLNFSFAFLNQTIIQIGNNITENKIALQNLIIQRANEIDNSLIQISTLVNLINSSVVNESLVIQSLVNIIGNNITENHVIINDLINLIGNNITENNINMISLIELVGNNITTNHFVIQTLIDYVSNNITDNHLEFLTNINLINNTIGQNQIELINRLLFINNSINQMSLDLTNQILLVNNTIYSAILDVYTSIEFNSDNILGNISLTYEQNDFLTELYKETMFSSLLNWSDVAFNYSLMESRVDVWEFINNYKNQSIEVHLRYQDIIDNLTITAQNSISQYLPKYDTDYNLWSVEDEEYLDDWKPLPENRTVPFGFYEETIPDIPDFNAPNTVLMIVIILMACGSAIALVGYMAYRYRKKSENYRRSYADKISLEAETIKNFSQGTRIK